MINRDQLTPEMQAEYDQDMRQHALHPSPEPVERTDIGRVEVIDATFHPPHTIKMECCWATGPNAGKMFTQEMIGPRDVCDDIVRNIERTALALQMIEQGIPVDVASHLGYNDDSDQTGE